MNEQQTVILSQLFHRESLEDILPLNNPISMQVDPTSLCNFRCTFCPTGDPTLIKKSGRSQSFIDVSLYKKIIDDISDFERSLKVLRLYKDGEPLLHPNFPELVEIAKKCKKIERVETTTNGSKLTKALNQRLIDAGLDRITISIEGVTPLMYLSVAKYKIDFENFVDNIRNLFENRGNMVVHIKTVAQNLNKERGEVEKFYEIFSPISDAIAVENTVSAWPNFQVENSVDSQIDAFGRPTIFKKICPYPFYAMSVNSDGMVSPCAEDWDRKLILGDVRLQSLKEIWEGIPLRSLRKSHVKDGLGCTNSCSSCGQVHYATHDNLDHFRDALIDRYQFDSD